MHIASAASETAPTVLTGETAAVAGNYYVGGNTAATAIEDSASEQA